MRKILGSALVVLLLAPAPVWASATGALSGRILPVAGAPRASQVWLAGADASSQPKSVPVLADGSFRADGLPAGALSMAVETSAGLYTVDTPVAIAPGATRTVSLALRGRQGTTTPPSEEEKKKKKKAGGFWSNPLYASLAVIGSAIVVGVIIDQATNNDNNTSTASPSTSGN